jgi:hypothetical protein
MNSFLENDYGASITVPILAEFLIDFSSESLSDPVRNRYRHQFGTAIAILRNPHQNRRPRCAESAHLAYETGFMS